MSLLLDKFALKSEQKPNGIYKAFSITDNQYFASLFKTKTISKFKKIISYFHLNQLNLMRGLFIEQNLP